MRIVFHQCKDGKKKKEKTAPKLDFCHMLFIHFMHGKLMNIWYCHQTIYHNKSTAVSFVFSYHQKAHLMYNVKNYFQSFKQNKKILFQYFYFKISHLNQCVTYFFVIICKIYQQFLSENCFYTKFFQCNKYTSTVAVTFTWTNVQYKLQQVMHYLWRSLSSLMLPFVSSHALSLIENHGVTDEAGHL